MVDYNFYEIDQFFFFATILPSFIMATWSMQPEMYSIFQLQSSVLGLAFPTVSVAQSRLTLRNPKDCSLPGLLCP